MASIRFLNVNTPDGPIPTVQLGGEPVQLRAVKDVGGTLYRRFIGASIEEPTLNQPLTSGQSTALFLDLPTPLPGRSFVSSAVDYDPTPLVESLTLPQAGYYRLRIAVPYQMVVPLQTTNLVMTFTTSLGATNTVRTVGRNAVAGSGIITFDSTLEMDKVSLVSVLNSGVNAVNIQAVQEPLLLPQPSTTQALLEINYDGTL